MKRHILLILILLLALPAAVHADDFRCLEGATNPGPRQNNAFIRACVNPKNDLYHGSVWRWYESGSLGAKEFYNNGAAEGEWSAWHENGKPYSRGSFKSGKKLGLWKYWDESGSLTTEVAYKPTGNIYVLYYPSGSRKATGLTLRGKKIGKWSYWDTKGQVKATCDFAKGLFALPDRPCQIIAEELAPKGYSRPIPSASLEPHGKAVLKIATESYLFQVPEGWQADVTAGLEDGVQLALYPQGGAWRGPTPNIYVRALFKDGRDFKTVVASESESFEQNVADYKEQRVKKGLTNSAHAVLAKTIKYTTLMQTDSPFAIVSSNTRHEMLAFLDASDQTVLLLVLTCKTQKEFKESRPAFSSLVASVQTPQEAMGN